MTLLGVPEIAKLLCQCDDDIFEGWDGSQVNM